MIGEVNAWTSNVMNLIWLIGTFTFAVVLAVVTEDIVATVLVSLLAVGITSLFLSSQAAYMAPVVEFFMGNNLVLTSALLYHCSDPIKLLYSHSCSFKPGNDHR